MPPSELTYLAGHPRLWWIVQSYERLVQLVLAIARPEHLQAGIQTHLPRSTGIVLLTTPSFTVAQHCAQLRNLLDTEEELLIADLQTPYEPQEVKSAIWNFRVSAPVGAFGEASWWKDGKQFIQQLDLHPHCEKIAELLPEGTMWLSIPPRECEVDIEQWQSQGKWCWYDTRRLR